MTRPPAGASPPGPAPGTGSDLALSERPDAPRFMITADEAYPVFEEAVLSAEREIAAGFRIFDPGTRLRSSAARAHGETWTDLLRAVLGRGVDVTLVLADFDPIAKPDLHRLTWRAMKQFDALARATAGAPGRISVQASMHAARVGWLPRLFFWPRIQRELGRSAARLNAMSPEAREAALAELPGLAPWLKTRGDKVRPRRLALPPLVPATHHQKLAVIDGRRLYIGGLDLNERRFDSPDHRRPAHSTWHDVQVMVDGPAAAEARAHLARFPQEVEGRTPPRETRHLLRTLSCRRRIAAPFVSPRPEIHEVTDAHLDRIARAERLIFIETQFFRDLRIARALARRARAAPGLQLLMVLPAAPEEVAFDKRTSLDQRFGEYLQSRCVRIVAEAFGARFFAASPAQPRRSATGGRDTLRGAPIIYVHAKLSVFDDSAAIISSANLNGRSLRWDTEAGICLDRPDEIRRLRERCFAHWLPRHADAAHFGEAEAVGAWRSLARRNAVTPPEKRQGFLLPFPERRARRFGEDVPVLPEEMV